MDKLKAVRKWFFAWSLVFGRIDLKDAFLLVPMESSVKNLFRFKYNKKDYPFSMSG